MELDSAQLMQITIIYFLLLELKHLEAIVLLFLISFENPSINKIQVPFSNGDKISVALPNLYYDSQLKLIN
jgi:hypothetical protein